MRGGVFSMTYLGQRGLNREGSASVPEAPLAPIVPGAWAAWARTSYADSADDDQIRDQSVAVTPRPLRRPAFHTTRG